tara:strand:+ start:584 stop:709 length:126 start_codon:yes stop_codon:yes gene_type:complete
LLDGFVIGLEGGVDRTGEDVLGPDPELELDWVLLLLLLLGL